MKKVRPSLPRDAYEEWLEKEVAKYLSQHPERAKPKAGKRQGKGKSI